MEEEIQIKLIKSTIGRHKKQKRIVKALGLRKINQIVTKKNNPAIMGMVNKVSHLLKIVRS